MKRKKIPTLDGRKVTHGKNGLPPLPAVGPVPCILIVFTPITNVEPGEAPSLDPCVGRYVTRHTGRA